MFYYRAACQFVVFTICRFVVACLSISEHGHHVREHYTWSVVLIHIKKYTQSFEFVDEAKNRSLLRSLLRDPQCHAVPIDITFPMYFKFKLDLSGNTQKDSVQLIVIADEENSRWPLASYLPISSRQRHP